MGRLEGRIALVTGAGRGLGHAVARGLAADGATVLAVARTASELADLARAIRAIGGVVETIQADLSDPAGIEALASDALERHDRIDILVNNAAVLRLKPFVELAPHEFNATVTVNLLAPVRLTRAVLPNMLLRNRGAIINVTSAAGIRPFDRETDYCASKHGLEGFSSALALEVADTAVSVNMLTPGAPIKPTSVTAAAFAAWPPARRAAYRDPLEMTDAFVWLATQEGVNGQRFNGFELAERIHAEGWDWQPEREGTSG